MYLDLSLPQCYLGDDLRSLGFIWLGILQVRGFEDCMILRTGDGQIEVHEKEEGAFRTLSVFSWSSPGAGSRSALRKKTLKEEGEPGMHVGSLDQEGEHPQSRPAKAPP